MLDSIHSNHGIHGISSLIGRELSRPRWRLDWHAKEELFQQVWVELLSRWPDICSRFRPVQGTMEAYLRRIVRNITIDELRRLGQRRMVLMEAEVLEHVVDEDAGPRAARELRAAIEIVLESLASRISPSRLEILKRRHMNGESVAEIARALDLPPEVVSRRLHEAKVEFHDAFMEKAQAGNESLQYLLNRKNS